MTTEADAIAKLATKASGAHIVHDQLSGRSFLALPEGFSKEEISNEHGLKLELPSYVKQSVTLQTADSLVEYVNRYKGVDSVFFADIDANVIIAQIDYHGHDRASHVAHRAQLKLSFSTEWNEWNKISGKLMDQLEFARFIEENGADVRAPLGAELLECVRDLQAHRKVNFIKAVRTSSENENFEYSDDTEAKSRKGGIEIPTKFQLGIPVYFGEPDIELYAFLRWKLGEGSLTLGIQLHRVEHVRQAVFQKIVLEVTSRSKCLAVFGKI